MKSDVVQIYSIQAHFVDYTKENSIVKANRLYLSDKV